LLPSQLLSRVVWQKLIDVSGVLFASIIREIIAFVAQMMDAASTFETSLGCYQTTWHNDPEDSRLQHQKLQ
jgi:hypothetical protein